MLMKAPYKTADELGITEEVFVALLETKRQLESGFIDPAQFDMIVVRSHPMECGTVACIGGWVGINMNLGLDATHKMVRNSYNSIRRLYFPAEFDTPGSGYDASPAQAADAIGNYLLTGDPMWQEIMAEEGCKCSHQI